MVLVALAPLAKAVADPGREILDGRCASCHNLHGPAPQNLAELRARKGPDLFDAGSRYQAPWLESWLQAPTRIRPAGMYYPDHIKSTPDGDQIDARTLIEHPRLSPSEAAAVGSTLMTLKAAETRVRVGEYVPGTISLSMGEMLFDKFKGCLACHQIEPGYGGLSGPELYTAGARLQPDYMLSVIREPGAWNPKSMMPNKHLRDSDAQRLVHYLRALGEEGSDD